MKNFLLTVEERTGTGKSHNRKLRAEGKVPAVVYGYGQEATPLQVAERDAERMLSEPVNLVDLDLDGDITTVIVKDVHREPVKGKLLHVDFYAVDLTRKLEVTVPIRIVGEDRRPSDGGVVEQHLWEIPVLCLPTEIPNTIDVDVSELELDQGLTVGDLEFPEGVEPLGAADEFVVKMVLPRAAVSGDEGAPQTEADASAEEGQTKE